MSCAVQEERNARLGLHNVLGASSYAPPFGILSFRGPRSSNKQQTAAECTMIPTLWRASVRGFRYQTNSKKSKKVKNPSTILEPTLGGACYASPREPTQLINWSYYMSDGRMRVKGFYRHVPLSYPPTCRCCYLLESTLQHGQRRYLLSQ